MPQVVEIFESGDYESQIRLGAGRLRDGAVVVLPTETVYGAAAVLTNPQARQRLGALRNNGGVSSGDDPKPFTIHLASRDGASKYLGEVSELGRRMMKKLWPGPVAIVFDVSPPRQEEVAKNLRVARSDIYSGNTITLRCPDHIVATDILARVEAPVALTLVSVAPSQTTSWDTLDDKVDLVFDAGPTRFSKPSTIVRVGEGNYQDRARGHLRSSHYRTIDADNGALRLQRKHLPFADGRSAGAADPCSEAARAR